MEPPDAPLVVEGSSSKIEKGGKNLRGRWKGLLRAAGKFSYWGLLWVLHPLNLYLARRKRGVKHPDSVLHISYMVHIPYYTTRLLRRFGIRADYLAIGASPVWHQCDFQKKPSPLSALVAWEEFRLLWRVVAKYEIIHLHFMICLSELGWELPLLKKMGRKIVVHYRGCEARDRKRLTALHPRMNICQQCDYDAFCETKSCGRRRALARKYGDYFLVTTPDLKDFVPEAEHLPFFAPEIEEEPAPPARLNSDRIFKIVHVTNHPGLEGTDQIRDAVERLREKGHAIHFVFLRGVPPDQVIREYRDADLAIGKMKMGWYANAQIESMALGVPTITYVRPEFMTDELRDSGFIFTTLEGLEQTLEYYLTHPEELEKKRRIARSSILRLHDNAKLCRRLIDLYASLKMQSDRSPHGSAAGSFKRDRGHV